MKSVYDVLIKPVISERSMGLIEENKYTFMVDPRCNRHEVKKAVEEIFKVQVADVNIMNTKGKLKRQGKTRGYTPDRKKAIVKLKPGNKIEIFDGL